MWQMREIDATEVRSGALTTLGAPPKKPLRAQLPRFRGLSEIAIDLKIQ